jgi:hypothetical protein
MGMSTTANRQPRGVHLVGSVPLANEEEVFTAAAEILGERLRRIPDGETGVRTNWIGWQLGVFATHPQLEAVPAAPDDYSARPRFRARAGVTADDIAFARLGYADAARASYATFARLKQAGAIPAGCRFQVSLPTPLAPIVAFVAPEAQAVVEPAYERRLLAELDEICAAIPHDQLAIQWDVAVEFALLEGVWPALFADVEGGIVERLVQIGRRVPDDVELGYHLCYGDAGHRHFKEPADAARLVEIANAVSAGVARPIAWIHLPVPRGRTDEAYFAPLRDLRLHPETELYLGLVHATDGAEGTRRRIATAQRVVENFGVATECGMGRRPPETIPALLRTHAEVVGPAT